MPKKCNLEYIPYYGVERKDEIKNKINLRSHRGQKALYCEIKNRFYVLKMDDIKNILSKCAICSQWKRTTTVQNTKPIILLKNSQNSSI